MKLVAAIILLGGLTAAALWVPYQGRTLWQRAEEKGVPSATAHVVGSAARSVGTAAASALRWATSSKAPPAAPLPEKKAARKAEKSEAKKAAPAPLRAEPKDVQPAPAVARAAPAPAPAPVVPKPVASERARTLALAPAPLAAVPPAATGGDKIVRTTAPERISSGDRAALDQLVAKARK
jgi:hypothetical protein